MPSSRFKSVKENLSAITAVLFQPLPEPEEEEEEDSSSLHELDYYDFVHENPPRVQRRPQELLDFYENGDDYMEFMESAHRAIWQLLNSRPNSLGRAGAVEHLSVNPTYVQWARTYPPARRLRLWTEAAIERSSDRLWGYSFQERQQLVTVLQTYQDAPLWNQDRAFLILAHPRQDLLEAIRAYPRAEVIHDFGSSEED